MHATHIKKFRNLLARADYSSVLSTTDANETYDNFMLIYKSLYETSCPSIIINKQRKVTPKKCKYAKPRDREGLMGIL